MKKEGRSVRKLKEGTIVSNKMQKTVVVSFERTMKHPRYGKVIRRNKKYYAHADRDDLSIGDRVEIMETKPLSKTKCWRVTRKIEANTGK